MSALAVFDSGLGGLSVVRALRAAGYHGALDYIADQAGFPYGERADEDVIARVLGCVESYCDVFGAPSALVVACNTASTLALGPLRARFAWPTVGTVPAIKPAAAQTKSGLISVLATPGTVARDYTRALIDQFAGDAAVTLVGAVRLAGMAERAFAGGPLDHIALKAEIAPAFVSDVEGRRTDTVVLACTHYPLILAALKEAAAWPVEWVDPAPAIARRVASVIGPSAWSGPSAGGRMMSTAPAPVEPSLAEALKMLALEAEFSRLSVRSSAPRE